MHKHPKIQRALNNGPRHPVDHPIIRLIVEDQDGDRHSMQVTSSYRPSAEQVTTWANTAQGTSIPALGLKLLSVERIDDLSWELS